MSRVSDNFGSELAEAFFSSFLTKKGWIAFATKSILILLGTWQQCACTGRVAIRTIEAAKEVSYPKPSSPLVSGVL